MSRLIVLASLAALSLAACSPAAVTANTETEPKVEAASVPAPPPGFELSHKAEAPTHTLASEIDPAILAFDPQLAYRLWTDNKVALDAMGVQAGDDSREMAEMANEDGTQPEFMPYYLEITHKATGTFGDVIAVAETASSSTGGAHPNYSITGRNYRKGEMEFLPLSAFVKDEAAFSELVAEALLNEKIAREAEPGRSEEAKASIREMLVPSEFAPDYYAGRFVLEPSSEAGKVGGITVLFSPYDVGSYAEGAYTPTMAAADLAPILTQEWASRFGGEPELSGVGEQ